MRRSTLTSGTVVTCLCSEQLRASLRSGTRLIHTGSSNLTPKVPLMRLGLTAARFLRALGHLRVRRLEVLDAGGYDDTDYIVAAVRPAGLEAVGHWPTPEGAADRLIGAVECLITAAPVGSDGRSSLVKLRDGALVASRNVLVAIASATLTGFLPRLLAVSCLRLSPST